MFFNYSLQKRTVATGPLFRFTGFLQSQARSPVSIYRVFTESSQAPCFVSQGFYRAEPGPLFRFTGFLQSQARSPFSIDRVFTESSQAPLFDLQGFYSNEPIFTSFLHDLGLRLLKIYKMSLTIYILYCQYLQVFYSIF